MSTTTPNMDLVVPSLGDDGSTAADQVATALTTIDSHDHSTGKGVKIGIAGINIDGDLELNSNNLVEANGVKWVDLSTALTGGTNVRTAYVFDGELYFNDTAGNQVQITAGGSIDTTVSGGFGGDYGATGITAIATYTDSSKEYEFVSEPTLYSTMVVGDLYVTEETAGINKHVRLKSPTSLAASYDIIFPAAQPASTSLLTMDSSGNIANTRDPSIDSVTTSAGVAVGTTLTVAGATTFSDNVVIDGSNTLTVGGESTLIENVRCTSSVAVTIDISAGGSITAAGDITTSTGEFKHGDLVKQFSPASGSDDFPTNGGKFQIQVIGGTRKSISPASAWHFHQSIPLDVGERIRSITFKFKQSAGDHDVSFKLVAGDTSGTNFGESVEATLTRNQGDGNVVSVTLSSIDYTVVANTPVFIRIAAASGTVGDELGLISITYDRP